MVKLTGNLEVAAVMALQKNFSKKELQLSQREREREESKCFSIALTSVFCFCVLLKQLFRTFRDCLSQYDRMSNH